MANKRIRALTEVTSMGDTDVVAIDNTTLSEAKKITKANLLTETTAAIALKEDSANKTTDLSVSNDILFPTTEAVNEGLDLKLNKDFIPFTEETVVVGTDVVPINTGASVLKKMTLDTIKTWIIETATFTLSTVSQTIKGAINELFTVSKKYSGFVNRTDSVISIDGSGVFTIEPAVASFDVYTNGTGKHTISATQTVTITEDQTITYVYFDNTGTLQKSTTSWDLVSGDNAPCAIIFKDATVYAVTDERHSYERNRAWHRWAHHNIGAMYKSGFTGTFTDTTLSVTQGVVADEDIEADSGGTKTTCSLWYRNGGAGMRLIRGSTTPYYAPAGVLKYDDGSGTPASVDNNKYTTLWVYATSDATEQIYVVIGQNNDTLVAAARNTTAPVINLSTAEWKLIYRVIYRNAGGTPTYIESADFRTVQTGVPSSAITTDHASLINRDAISSHPASAIGYDNSVSGLTATDAQEAIDALDIALKDVGGTVTDHEERITDLEEIATSPIYGCVWDKTPTSTGTRIGACKNFVANVGIDDQLVINDFDSAPIFSELKEVTDTLGNVFIRIPKFYIRKRSETGWLSKEVSKYQYDGFYLPKCFWDFTNEKELDYVYYGKNPASLNVTKLESKAGVNPLVNTNIVNFRTYAEANNAGGLLGYQQLDIHAYDALVTLMQIEFATLHMQSVMQGFTTGQYLAGHTLTADTNPAGNALVVANATGALYRVGQSIGVGTTLGGNQRFYGRVITQIDADTPSAGSTTITFDGDVVALTTGDILYNVGWRNGFSYDIAASSGCIVANDGKYPCMYRGIENPYGNVWQFVDGVNITARQAWVCDDADDYASNFFAAPYKQLSYVNASTSNYVKEMGFDANNPFAEFPASVDVVDNSPYKDYYYQDTAAYIGRVGGSFTAASSAGPSYWYLGSVSSIANVTGGGRLLKKSI